MIYCICLSMRLFLWGKKGVGRALSWDYFVRVPSGVKLICCCCQQERCSSNCRTNVLHPQNPEPRIRERERDRMNFFREERLFSKSWVCLVYEGQRALCFRPWFVILTQLFKFFYSLLIMQLQQLLKTKMLWTTSLNCQLCFILYFSQLRTSVNGLTHRLKIVSPLLFIQSRIDSASNRHPGIVIVPNWVINIMSQTYKKHTLLVITFIFHLFARSW